MSNRYNKHNINDEYKYLISLLSKNISSSERKIILDRLTKINNSLIEKDNTKYISKSIELELENITDSTNGIDGDIEEIIENDNKTDLEVKIKNITNLYKNIITKRKNKLSH
jgi:hypothetical protein